MNDLYKDKKILVVGAGRSGIASVKALKELGADVTIQDSKKSEDIDEDFLLYLKEKNIEPILGENPEAIEEFQCIVLSPGVPPNLKFIEEARDKGIEIIGELELAYRIGKGKYAAITGTNGKTTTTTLVGEMFKADKKETFVVGNIGVAVVSKALEAKADTWLVTETSSFQLETVHDFKPKVSALLNLTPDHMDRHKTMKNYGNTKAEIFKNQEADDYIVVNFDDKRCLELTTGAKATVVPFSRIEQLKFGVFVKDGIIVIKNKDEKLVEFCRIDQLQIPGSHNLENALAATGIAFFAGVSTKAIIETLKSFKGVEHRIEFVKEVNGVKFINDSKGTNTDAAIKAIEAMKGNVVLIAGGYDKGSTYDKLIDAFDGKVKAAVLLGKTAVKIKDTAEKKGFTKTIIVKDMEDCVKEAYRVAEKGDNVLLSPACASWDMYDNFEIRGNHFKECVSKLEK